MSKKTEKKVAPVEEKPSEAMVKGMFVVPVEKQEPLRKLDEGGAAIQRELGALELDYLFKKNQLLSHFQKNRTAYEQSVSGVAKAEGVDLEKVKEPWNFDFKTMTFSRESAKGASAMAPTPGI
jgi:hypothetical protein